MGLRESEEVLFSMIKLNGNGNSTSLLEDNKILFKKYITGISFNIDLGVKND